MNMQKKGNISDKLIRVLFVLPALALFAIIIVIPVLSAVPYSLFNLRGFRFEEFIGLRNYINMLQSQLFWNALRNTIIYTLLNSAIMLSTALIVSILLYSLAAKRKKGYRSFRTVFLTPICLSSAVVGFMWQFIYHPRVGLLNGLLSLIGLEEYTQAWLANERYILLLLIIPAIWQWGGFYIILLFTSIMNVPSELTEAAMIDGASRLQTIRKVIIPMITPTLEYVCILALTGAARAFDLIWIMTRGGPGNASETIALYMYRQAFNWGNFEMGTTIGISLFVICAIFVVINRKIFERLNWDK